MDTIEQTAARRAVRKDFPATPGFTMLQVRTCFDNGGDVDSSSLDGEELPEENDPFYSIYGIKAEDGETTCIGDFITAEAAIDTATRLAGPPLN